MAEETRQPSRLSQAITTQQQAGNAVAPKGENSVEALMRRMAGEFGKVLGPALPADTFVRLALNEVRANPRLLECSQQSLLGALMTSARLNLEPGGPLGQFYLTPRRVWNKSAQRKEWSVVPIIGYRGLRDLALRSGKVASIQSFLIREGDEFRYGSNETRGFWHEWTPLDTDEDESDRPWKGVLTIAQLSGTNKPVWRYLSHAAVMARKGRGSAGDEGPWATDEEAMARKTGIRAIVTDLPSSSVMLEASRVDEQVQVWHAGAAKPEPLQHDALPPAEGNAQVPDTAPSEDGVNEQTGEVPTPPAEQQAQPRRSRRQAQAEQQAPVQEPPADEPPDPGPWTPPGPDGRV